VKALYSRCFLILVIILMCSNANSQDFIKTPNVSGQFYPSDKNQLNTQIDNFFAQAKVSPVVGLGEVVISPHAGYMYSGGVAACGYKAIEKQKVSTVVILAPTHHARLSGISIWAKGFFEMPFGPAVVDEVFAEKLLKKENYFQFLPQAFEKEHSLEVQIPFIQKTFKDAKIVPVIVGQLGYEQCVALASALDEIIADRKDVLIVVSTDMSHYHDGKTAKKMDEKTLELIKNLDARDLMKQCSEGSVELCGIFPVVTVLLYAQKRNLDVSILKYADSGDVTGDKTGVVGYFSAVLYKSDDKKESEGLNGAQKKRLIDIAKQTIEKYVTSKDILEVKENDQRLMTREGAFVTLHKDGKLRGCIGNIVGRDDLYKTVKDMAVASCSQDSRFSAVKKDELNKIEIEISVLSIPRQIKNIDEIMLGVHGVIVSRGPLHKGLFLPQVATEQGWTKEQFLSYLCAHKAGLPSDAWKDSSTKIEIFTADVFSEKDFSK